MTGESVFGSIAAAVLLRPRRRPSMPTRGAHVLVLALFAVLCSHVPARADSIRVTFTAVPAAGDPVNTAPSTGTFTFDSRLIPAGGGQVQDVSGLGATA